MRQILKARPPYFLKAVAVSLGVCVTLTLFWWYIGVHYREKLLTDARTSVQISLNAYGNALSSGVRQRIELLSGLRAFVETNPSRKDLDRRFVTYAAALYRGGVWTFSVAPSGVRQYVFPDSKPPADGLHPHTPYPARKPPENLQQLKRARNIVLEQPYNVPPDGLHMVARQSVFLREKWWGTVEVVLDVHAILAEAGSKAVTPYLNLALLDSQNHPFYSEGPVMDSAPVIRRIVMPGGTWSLAAVPVTGWESAIEPQWFYFKLSGGVIIGLLTSLVFVVFTYQGNLRFLVLQRTTALRNELSERKLAEQARQKSEQNYRLLYNSIQDAILVTDTECRILHFNNAFTELFGYRLNDVKGKPFRFLCERQEDACRFGGEIVEDAADRELSYTVNYRKKNGEVFPGETNVFRLKSGTGTAPGYIGLIRDLTEHHRAQDRIRHLNRVLHTIREVNSLIFREKNIDLLISQICDLIVKNRGYAGALLVLTDERKRPGKYAEAGSGETFQMLSHLLHQRQTIPCCAEALEQPGIHVASARPGTCAGCPHENRCGTDEVLCVRLEHKSRVFGHLSVILVDGLSEDLEEQGLLEEMVKDISLALYTIEMEEQTRQSEQARKKAEDQLRQARKMESIGRLAGGVAHDFNNMLNVILGYAGMALNRLPDENAPFYQEFKEIEQAAWHSADLTEQLLAFSRQQAVEPQRVDLNEIIGKQVKLLQSMVGEEIEIRFLPCINIWPIMADPSQMIQIFTNLAANARDAIEKTGVITIETANVKRDNSFGPGVDSFPRGDFVQLTFSDTGVGMDEQMLERIFEPFFTTKELGKGTGLGLATVYGIVGQNKGIIHVYSEPKIGTTFKMYFPRHAYSSAEHASAGPDRRSFEGTETVLIVEDEEQMLNLAEMILQQYGYTVFKARAPGEAIDFVRQHAGRIDLLLTDVILPDLDGDRLKNRIEMLQPGIKTVFMSGYSREMISHRGILDAEARLIQKPFQAPLLAASVRSALDGDSGSGRA